MDDDSKLQSVAIPRQFLEKKLDMLQSPRISLMKISPWENSIALKLHSFEKLSQAYLCPPSGSFIDIHPKKKHRNSEIEGLKIIKGK